MLGIVRTLLVADAQINTAVGENIFVGYAPKEMQTTYIILESFSQTPNDCKDRQSVMDSYVFGVTVIGTQYSVVETLLKRCRVVLDGHKDSSFKGISFNGIEEVYDGTQDYHIKTNSYKSLIIVP